MPGLRQRRRLLGAATPVQRQTRDVVQLLRTVQSSSSSSSSSSSELALPRFAYYLFMEDDFLPCGNALLGLWYLIGRANADHGAGNWAALRVSYGLNGIVSRVCHLNETKERE